MAPRGRATEHKKWQDMGETIKQNLPLQDDWNMGETIKQNLPLR